MTVMTNESSKRFHGAGSAGPFTWTWRFLSKADLLVYLILAPDEEDVSREVRTLLTEGVDYTVTGAGSYAGGSLTLTEPLAEGADLLVRRSTKLTQEVSIRNQGNNFRPATHEDIFDRLTMMVQDRDRDLAEKSDVVELLKARIEQAEIGTSSFPAEDGTGRFFKVTIESGGLDDNGDEILFPKITPL